MPVAVGYLEAVTGNDNRPDVVMSAGGEGRHFVVVARMSPLGTLRTSAILQLSGQSGG
jgi:hypothetical protein